MCDELFVNKKPRVTLTYISVTAGINCVLKLLLKNYLRVFTFIYSNVRICIPVILVKERMWLRFRGELGCRKNIHSFNELTFKA